MGKDERYFRVSLVLALHFGGAHQVDVLLRGLNTHIDGVHVAVRQCFPVGVIGDKVAL